MPLIGFPFPPVLLDLRFLCLLTPTFGRSLALYIESACIYRNLKPPWNSPVRQSVFPLRAFSFLLRAIS